MRSAIEAPKEPDLELWQTYLETKNAGKETKTKKSELAIKRIEGQISYQAKQEELKDLEIRRRKNELIERDDVDQMLARMGSSLNVILTGILETQILTMAGSDVETLRKWGRAQKEDFCARMQKSITDWRKQSKRE